MIFRAEDFIASSSYGARIALEHVVGEKEICAFAALAPTIITVRK